MTISKLSRNFLTLTLAIVSGFLTVLAAPVSDVKGAPQEQTDKMAGDKMVGDKMAAMQPMRKKRAMRSRHAMKSRHAMRSRRAMRRHAMRSRRAMRSRPAMKAAPMMDNKMKSQ